MKKDPKEKMIEEEILKLKDLKKTEKEERIKSLRELFVQESDDYEKDLYYKLVRETTINQSVGDLSIEEYQKNMIALKVLIDLQAYRKGRENAIRLEEEETNSLILQQKNDYESSERYKRQEARFVNIFRYIGLLMNTAFSSMGIYLIFTNQGRGFFVIFLSLMIFFAAKRISTIAEKALKSFYKRLYPNN